MRQTLADHIVTISRACGTLTFPANFQLIAAMNPCPCGYFSDPTHNCSCSPSMVTRYQKRISGPLLDRFDIHMEVPRVDYEKLASDRAGESSAAVRTWVLAARERQQARFDTSGLTCNADTPALHRRQFALSAAKRRGRAWRVRCKCGPGAHPRVLRV